MNQCLILLFLGVNSWIDIRKKQISLITVFLFSGIEILQSLCAQRLSWETVLPAGIGVLFLAFSIVTKGALGMGDAWILLALGTAMSVELFLTVLFLGVFGCAAVAAVLFLFFHKGRHTEIPMIPFLLAGYVGGLLLC